jgi:hypothetical protein
MKICDIYSACTAFHSPLIKSFSPSGWQTVTVRTTVSAPPPHAATTEGLFPPEKIWLKMSASRKKPPKSAAPPV